MKRFLTMVAAVAVLVMASSAFATNEPYTWTISASSTNPFVNTTSFVPSIKNAYLWLACCDLPDPMRDGASAAEFGIFNVNPANLILGFTPAPGVLNAGTATEPLLAIGGCPPCPLLVGTLLLLNQFPPDQVCLRPSLANGIKGTVDCEPAPALHPIAWIGLSKDGTPPCTKGDICKMQPTSVEDSSFGRIKSIYR